MERAIDSLLSRMWPIILPFVILISPSCSSGSGFKGSSQSGSAPAAEAPVEPPVVDNKVDEKESKSKVVQEEPKPEPEPMPPPPKQTDGELTPVTNTDKKVPIANDPLYKLCVDAGPLPNKDPNKLFCSQDATTGVPLNKWAMDCNGGLVWRYCKCSEVSPGVANWGECRNEAPSAIPVKDIYPVK